MSLATNENASAYLKEASVRLESEPAIPSVALAELAGAKSEIIARCKSAELPVEESIIQDGRSLLKVGLRNGKEFRWLALNQDEWVTELRSVEFEKLVFISDYQAICSFTDGFLEAGIRPVASGFVPSSHLIRRLFDNGEGEIFKGDEARLVLESTENGLAKIEISRRSALYARLFHVPFAAQLTLKITGATVTTHDSALSLLKKTADAVFFQVDKLSGVAVALDRERRPFLGSRRQAKKTSLKAALQYPKTEFDDAPISLYWYGRSASGMPLLQFLAFYQVIEFYFPTYSKAEAQRKLKGILKDPTFRGDRDADIGKLLSAIQFHRSGAFGDERSQLRATLRECVDASALRDFLEASEERKQFYTAKATGQPYHKVPLSNPAADLRDDVADRVYDIRCKIVHTKEDAQSSDLKQLLPFSKEAHQLVFDIELAQYLAQSVLISASTPFRNVG